jgi:hypothetical protein
MRVLASFMAIAAISTANLVGFSASAGAQPLAPGLSKETTGESAVIRVHDRGDRHYRRKHRRYRHHDRHVVDAPFTYVETDHGGRVEVDAPFTSVRVGRRGTWVRAPFVDIYVPR